MGEAKIEFQENNNGLRFYAQTIVPYGNIFLWVSFRNESHRLIFDLWVINGRQNYRFEMIAPCPFDMMADSLFEMMMAIFSKWRGLSFRNDGLTVTSRWLMILSSKDWWLSLRHEDDALFERWDWMPSAAFETTVIFLVIEERCCVRACLLSKG